MLDKHLICKTCPITDSHNIVFWRDYRISILGEKLFRLEKSVDKKFRDEATLSVWFRNMPIQQYSVEETSDSIIISTDSVTLIVKENREDCRIVVDGIIKIIDNSGNLLGTSRTLDCFDGDKDIQNEGKRLQLDYGVCSKTGVAVYDDSKSETLAPTGEIVKEYAHGTDEYIFAFGSDYRGAVKALYNICGGVPLVPRFALGNWWSRYREYSDEEYLTVLHRFKEHNIPLSVATVDMDWHYSIHLDEQKRITESGKNTEYYGGTSGWTGYSWNKELFPDYKEFLRSVKNEGLKITLNLHPADGVRWFEDMYKEMAQAVGKDPSLEEKIGFDIFDPVFTNAYFSVLHKPYEKDGVDFWWIDWQQGKTAGKLGLDPLWALNHYHYLDNAKNSENPLILSRYAGVGSHRYPLGFSGDTSITWATLKYLPYFTATASNIGYGWWSHDIGGHQYGTHDGELYLRHAQYGVFSPINRYHCTSIPTVTKEPWAYKNGTGALIEEQMRLRHKLVPFLYTCDYNASKEAEMLIEPLYYYHPNNTKAYEYGDEYYFGKSLLVAPVTSSVDKDGYARIKVWLPKGNYTDIFTGDNYYVNSEEGEEKTLLRTLESILVLAKEGTILPLSEDNVNGTPNPVVLTIKVFSGNGTFTLYEDGRENGSNDEFFTTFSACEFHRADGEVQQILKIQSHGEKCVIPQNRKMCIRFENIEKGNAILKINGNIHPFKKIYADCVIVELLFNANEEYEISVDYIPEKPFDKWIKRVTKILSESNGSNTLISEELDRMSGIHTRKELEMYFASSRLPECVIERLKETL